MGEIRKLTPKDVKVREKSIFTPKTGAKIMLLIYIDSRAVMQILDEAFGPLGWKRTHKVIGDDSFCCISVWDENKQQWIDKEDVGTESYTEKVKGKASDSFKRAATNWGVGRELYTKIKIIFDLNDDEWEQDSNKKRLKSWISFSVTELEVSDSGDIEVLQITDQQGRVRFSVGQTNLKYGKNDNHWNSGYIKTKDGMKHLTELSNAYLEFILVQEEDPYYEPYKNDARAMLEMRKEDAKRRAKS